MSDPPWPVHPAADLFPLLADNELAELAEDIRSHGLLEPVWLYDDPELGRVVLDGRNRLRACELAGVEPRTRMYTGDDPYGFAISLNLHRRHLTVGQRAMVADEIADLHRGANQHAQNCAPSQSKAAELLSVSRRSVQTARKVKDEAPDLAEKVKTGEMDLGRADRIIRDREAEQRRIAKAQREAAAQPEPTRVDIRHGDFRHVLADLENVDAIITDPPYPAEYLPLLGDLAAWADKVLTPDGVLAVLIGQTHLPDVYRLLDGHRPYRWTCCYLTEGAGYVSYPRRVQSNWKPLIVYGGGPRIADVVRSIGSDADAKNNHKWGQDYQAFHTVIERLTSRGQTVVDPFMGSGTTLMAAKALGRHTVGCDIAPGAVTTARERLT